MSGSTRRRTTAGRCYAFLVRVFPSGLAHRYGGEMVEAFERELVTIRARRGRLHAGLFVVRASADAIRAGVGEHRRCRSRWFADLGQDVRFSLRSLARSRGFTLVAVGSLALGLGVNTAFFSFVRATFLRPVPGVTGADRVVELLAENHGREQQEWTFPDFEDLRAADTPFEAIAGWKRREGSLRTDTGGQRVSVMYVTPDYFRALGVAMSLGRGFGSSGGSDHGQDPVAIVSHAMWRRQLDGGPDVVDRTIVLNGVNHTVVGVTPEAFRGHWSTGRGPDLYVPLAEHPFLGDERAFATDRAAQWLLVLARLRPGATVDQANAALQTVFAGLARTFPDTNRDRGARAVAFGPMPAYGRTDSLMAMGALFGLTGLVLVVICGNLAGMVLARSATREREIAVRLALGCGRARLARLSMVEALLLALAGGSVGVLAAYWNTGYLFANIDFPIGDVGLKPDGVVLGLSLVLALATTLVVGLFPALWFTRQGLVAALKDEAGAGGRRVGRVHRLATSAQTGLALLLLVACGLLVRAVDRLDHRDLGFEPRQLLIATMDLSFDGRATPEAGRDALDRVRGSIAALPGVAAVSLGDGIPLDLVGNYTQVARADRADEEQGRVRVEFTRITEGYFEAIGTPIVRGRGIEPGDDEASAPVVVVTESLAERLWPGVDALGRQLRFTLSRSAPRTFTVVGVVPHIASSRPTEDQPHVFVSLRQAYSARIMAVVRAAAPSSALAGPLRSALLDAEPGLPASEIVMGESLVARSTQGQRASASLSGGLGLLALLLSAIGVYGVVAFAVANRTHEIGVRMALGATREQVLGGIVGDAVRLALPGLAVGALVASGAGAAMGSMLLGVSPVDPSTYGLAIGLLLVVVLLASLLPARRASAIDPMAALRRE